MPLSRFSFQWILRFASDLRSKRGWRRYVTSFAYGVLLSFAYPPTDVLPALFLAFPALIFLLQGAPNWRSAFLIGWSFAFGFFIFDLYWTAASMFVDLAHFWWAVPLALFGLPSILALFYGIATLLAYLFGTRGFCGIIIFSLLWFLADYARGHLFTGFPWNIAGYVWADFLPVLQSVSIIGIYGLTLLTLLIASLPALLAETEKSASHKRLVAAAFLILGAIALWGGVRVLYGSTATLGDMRLRLVQPDVIQRSKWMPSTKEHNFQELLAISSLPAEKPLRAIIWPETASTYYLTQDLERRRAVAGTAPRNGVVITGVLRSETDLLGTQQFFNSLIAVSDSSQVIGVYDKAHLVPFGEYIPYRDIFALPPIAGIGLDFSQGPGPQSLKINGLPPFSPLICYEAIFSGHVADRKDPPQFLLNVTNDGWYGHTAGPYQHFAIARARAVEEGMPLVRAANTGISGIIDSFGRITVRLGLGERGFVDGDLPIALPEATAFVRYGEMPLWLMFASLAFAALLRRALITRAQK